MDTKVIITLSIGLEALQSFEIPQNRQNFLWKSLEKKGGDLEKLGEKAWRIPGRRSVLGTRALSPWRAFRLSGSPFREAGR
jgi:hypothetical protein